MLDAPGAGTPSAAGLSTVDLSPNRTFAGDVASRDARAGDRTPPREARVPDAGSGDFRVAGGVLEPAGDSNAMTYTVEVEEGLGFDPEATARSVDAVLGDERDG
ncbi:uncharacterized protein PD653_3909 [Nocardioides sp. PD653]|nr:uncharacterized protein PD653B2_2116 [Nocardioides sp. PD653-B2]GAW56472.1 uncharacterized protein PD653_3909 [Nocardioides sp. PD653]